MVLKPGDRSKIVRTGAFMALALAIIGASIFMLGSENNVFSSTFEIYGKVKNAQNLKTGAAVQLKGIKVGTVSDIIFTRVDELQINLNIDSAYRQWIREDSYVAFKTQGVLGDRFLEILGGSEAASPIKEESFIRVDENSIIDKIVGHGEGILQISERILVKIDNLMGSVEQNRLDNILSNLEQTTNQANKVLASFGGDDLKSTLKNANEASFLFKQTTSSLNEIAKQIKDGPGSLNSLIYDRALHDDLQTLLGGANRNKVLKYFIRESIKKADER